MVVPGGEPRRRLGWLDLLLLLGLAGAAALVAYRVDAVLNYRWHWQPIPQYILRWDPARGWVPNLLLQGLATTLRLALWSMAASAVLGVAIGLARRAQGLFPRLVARAYVELMRNAPPLVLIFIAYFFVSSQVMPRLGIEAAIARASPATLAVLGVLFGDPKLLANFLAGLACLALLESAYIAEIVRAGIAAVAPGQWEAAAALGLPRWPVFRRVILPQALQRMVPALCGQFIALVKDTSIVSLVSIQDLTFMATDIAVSTTRVFETWITAALIYFLVCFGLSLAFTRLERRLARRWR